MKKQLTTDEVQEVLNSLETYIVDLKARWDQENPQIKSWWKIPRNHILITTKFIIDCLDELINFVEPIISVGSDKKLAVMIVTGKIFDYIVVNSFPLWLKPFVPTIRMIVVNIVVDSMIDFIVEKYKSGFWKQEAKDGEEKFQS